MIDQGFCFNAGEWNFPDAPLRGLYARHRVYESVRGIESFEPWLTRIETKINEETLWTRFRRRFRASGTILRPKRWKRCWSSFCDGGSW